MVVGRGQLYFVARLGGVPKLDGVAADIGRGGGVCSDALPSRLGGRGDGDIIFRRCCDPCINRIRLRLADGQIDDAAVGGQLQPSAFAVAFVQSVGCSEIRILRLRVIDHGAEGEVGIGLHGVHRDLAVSTAIGKPGAVVVSARFEREMERGNVDAGFVAALRHGDGLGDGAVGVVLRKLEGADGNIVVLVGALIFQTNVALLPVHILISPAAVIAGNGDGKVEARQCGALIALGGAPVGVIVHLTQFVIAGQADRAEKIVGISGHAKGDGVLAKLVGSVSKGDHAVGIRVVSCLLTGKHGNGEVAAVRRACAGPYGRQQARCVPVWVRSQSVIPVIILSDLIELPAAAGACILGDGLPEDTVVATGHHLVHRVIVRVFRRRDKEEQRIRAAQSGCGNVGEFCNASGIVQLIVRIAQIVAVLPEADRGGHVPVDRVVRRLDPEIFGEQLPVVHIAHGAHGDRGGRCDGKAAVVPACICGCVGAAVAPCVLPRGDAPPVGEDDLGGECAAGAAAVQRAGGAVRRGGGGKVVNVPEDAAIGGQGDITLVAREVLGLDREGAAGEVHIGFAGLGTDVEVDVRRLQELLCRAGDAVLPLVPGDLGGCVGLDCPLIEIGFLVAVVVQNEAAVNACIAGGGIGERHAVVESVALRSIAVRDLPRRGSIRVQHGRIGVGGGGDGHIIFI